VGLPSWHDALEEFEGELYPSYYSVWTGFYGRETARVSPLWEVGCRVLGERREDRFGTSVGSNGDWLYVSAPDRTARVIDGIPDLAADRSGAGVVYQIRTNAVFGNSSATRTQLWIEYGTQTVEDPNDPNLTIDVDVAWPNPDVQIPDREDWSMPVPHQYIIGLGGSIRGEDTNFSGSNLTSVGDGDRLVEYNFTGTGCLNGLQRTVQAGVPADAIRGDSYPAYGPGRSSWYLSDELWYIVGPHIGSHLSHVRGLEDVNDDGLPDFAVGSGDVYEDFTYPDAPSGAIVGGVFIVFSREAGVSGSYLLDRIALPPTAGGRLRGVFLRGSSAGEKLGRVFDSAGDMNGDGVGDVIVGSEGSDSSRGKAIVVLGSRTLESPAGGWTVSDIVEAGHAVLFRGVDPNDLAGANVAGAGDVDGDGYDDILIAAPGANQGRGVVYLIYGSFGLAGEYSLADVGTLALPGCVYLGRGPTDALGGGRLVFDALDSSAERRFFLNPGDPGAPYPQRVEVYSRGVARLGDLDNDGRDEYSISAMLADVNGRVDSGEVYVLYGRGD
jgi:hypothetical protein